MTRLTWAEVDLSAIAHNVAYIRKAVAPAMVCAVVKADAYGHGAVEVARTALAAGAKWLAVALVEEAAELRNAGIDAPILLLTEPSGSDAMREVFALDVRPIVCSQRAVNDAADVAKNAGKVWPLHLKVDTGMHRIGCHVDNAVDVGRAIRYKHGVRFEGLCTHLATADDLDAEATGEQLAIFDKIVTQLRDGGIRPKIVHAGNSAGALLHPQSRYDMVRIGISMYGYPPAPQHTEIAHQLRPALRLISHVGVTRFVQEGDAVSYGHRWQANGKTCIATIPIGYADGVRRSLGLDGGYVLIHGLRRPIVGVVTMDQLMVACHSQVSPGDEVVLIGRQHDAEITADEIAKLVGTISYEVLCAIGKRVPRRYIR